MEEDELGTQRTIGHPVYATCSRCGRQAPSSMMNVVPGDAFDDNSEFKYLCSTCQQELADGEQDLPTTLA